MADRLNQYQRRVEDRQLTKISTGSLILTSIIFGIGYWLFNGSITQSEYAEVLASNGAETLAQAQVNQLGSYVMPFLIVWLVLALLMTWTEHKKHNRFEFDAPVIATRTSGRSKRAINFHKLTPRQFEEYVAQLISQQGYKANVVGGAGDRGVDIKVYNSYGQLVGVVQCKRYKPGTALSPMFVREMATVMRMHGVSIGYLATTTYFTEETKRLAKQLGVRLIDGHDLKHIFKETYVPQFAPPVAQPPATTGYNGYAQDEYGRFRPPQQPARRANTSCWPANRTQPGTPVIRQAPQPINREKPNIQPNEIVPGHQSLPNPSNPFWSEMEETPSKEMLRRARDNQIRRAQSEQGRKKNPPRS